VNGFLLSHARLSECISRESSVFAGFHISNSFIVRLSKNKTKRTFYISRENTINLFNLFKSTILIVLFLSTQANAFIITDVYNSDANRITNSEYEEGIPEVPPFFSISENYGETYRLPYSSHDGFGIVNAQGNFFDIVVAPSAGDTGIDIWTLAFSVKNLTPFDWSDYHFEFWNADFTQRISNFPLTVGGLWPNPNGPWHNQFFQNNAFDGSVLSFWGPDNQNRVVTNGFTLTMNLSQIGTSFGIRQVATTTPEPGTLTLLGVGLVVFILTRKFK
jgi:hypothetical protein